MVYVSKNQSTTLQLEDSGRHDKDDNQAVEVLDALLEKATHQGASDIHIEPQQDLLRIRQRVDGILVVTHSLPKELARRLISRIKVLAHLDISERRLPQDGRIKHAAMSELADVRVSTLPTLWGEKAVLRLLDHAPTELGLDALGMNRKQQEQFTRALDLPQGLILVTGPTGSGKTLTLYSGLRHLNNEQSNIITVEDPVEIRLRGANQIAVNTKLGLGFAQILRALMRQDPDVIMVGEIRDFETATAAIRAAQTGHLVLSTLHTGSTGSTLARLHQMGIKLYDLTSTITLVIAQRLARRLCDQCKQPDPPHAVYRANPPGCSQCFQGYRGRVGIFELLPFSDRLISALHECGSKEGIIVPAEKFIRTSLHDSAMTKVAEGVTSMEEANRLAPI